MTDQRGDKKTRPILPIRIRSSFFILSNQEVDLKSAHIMVWSKTKKAIVWGAVAVVLLVVAILLFLNWHDIQERMRIAAGERAIAKHIATPIDLTGYYARPASSLENSSSYWGEVPWEFQVFHGVPLQIDGIIYLWGAGNAKVGAVFPEEVSGITVNQKFDMLYVYHCTFFNSPPNTPVYDIVFRYDDGESETNTVQYGVDVIDFNTPGGKKIRGPSGPNSRTAWIGSSFTSDGAHPLLFSLTGIKNLRPFAQVASIDLFSCKNQSAGVVFAMTTGPTNLMK